MKAQIHSTMTRRLPWLLAVCGLWLSLLATANPARADIVVRISVKVILNPATGLRPPTVSDLVFSNTVAGMNALLAKFGRGYHYEWVGNALIDVGGLGQFNSGPSHYYNVDFTDDDNANQEFESNAIAHPLIYGWDTNAVNLYVANMGGKAAGSVTKGNHIFLIANPAIGHGYSSTGTTIHELGHHFSLRHTHQGELDLNADATVCTNGCNCAILIGGNSDLVADTIADHECWHSQDEIAQGNYGMNYADLTFARQAAVDRVWFNIMSYHGDFRGNNDAPIFTSDQLDRWTDSANNNHPNEVGGLTRFVDRNNTCLVPNGSSACLGGAGGPFPTIANGMNRADAGDIVLIRPGNYNEPMTLNKAVTFRATRGDAVIGKP